MSLNHRRKQKMTKREMYIQQQSGVEIIGRSVVYEDNGRREYGFITSWNDMFIFVCFDKSGHGVAGPYEKVRFDY
jgi:hypothetical protein